LNGFAMRKKSGEVEKKIYNTRMNECEKKSLSLVPSSAQNPENSESSSSLSLSFNKQISMFFRKS
jgi:hypothetical protein